MGMGRRKREDELFVATIALPRGGVHPFYDRVNEILNERGFDGFAENLCRKFYADKVGRPSLAPAIYFRLLMIGYFEGIDSERGIAWRLADSLALRRDTGESYQAFLTRLATESGITWLRGSPEPRYRPWRRSNCVSRGSPAPRLRTSEPFLRKPTHGFCGRTQERGVSRNPSICSSILACRGSGFRWHW
jgi:hypothetical protein